MGRLLRTGLPAALLMVCLLGTGPVAAKDVKVAISGGYEEIEAHENNDVMYVSLSELAEILGGTLDWEMIGHRVVYEQTDQRFTMIIGAPYFRLADSLFNLTYPIDFRDGKVFVPAQTFIPFLDRVVTQKITWNPDNETIRVDSDYFTVTDMGVSPKANGILIEIFLTRALNYELFVTEGNWVNVSIRDARLNRARIESRRNSRVMYTLKTHQVDNTGQVSFRLRRSIGTLTHKLVFNPPRIQISIADSDFQLDTTPKPVVGPDEKIDVIVIDPGHGGRDYGAVGQSGTKEKDVVLDISRELAKKIRKDKQFKVILTRDRDEYVSLDKRAKIANDAGADLFISIHANASPKRHVRGWNVFFLAPAKNDSARAVEQFENSFFLRELAEAENQDQDTETFTPGIDPVSDILNQMIMTEFQVESHDLAMMVDREFRRRLKHPARGVDQAGFFVLNKVFTPSVLVESAFISNKTEEKMLRRSDFQRDVAESIYQAIKRFKAKYELASKN
ncbi:hypothetical protein GF420_13825 [candidate division GN15 bacterium]|nr:hypothetical protein [candidate division GN15 bacterium]